MDKSYQSTPDIWVLPANFPIPGMGVLPVNAFLIKGREPVLIDTGMGIDDDQFINTLKAIIDPKDLKWIWLTHDDADHTGNIQKVLEIAPDARLIANSLAVLRMSTAWSVPMNRVYWLNPGESISIGDRSLFALRPPLFDNPTAIAAYDEKSKALFSADCFGAILPSPAINADDVPEEILSQGMKTWASADSPWVHMVEPEVFKQSLDKIHTIAPKMIFSAHLPPAKGRTEQFLGWLAAVPASTPFVAPNQEVFKQIFQA